MHFKLGLVLVLVGLVTGLSGCAKAKIEEGGRWVQAAPASAAQTGYLVTAGPSSSVEVEKLLEKNGGQARVLNSAEGTYEVFGVSPEAITAALPTATVRKNVYFENLLDAAPAPAAPVVKAFLSDCAALPVGTRPPEFKMESDTHKTEFAKDSILQSNDAQIALALDGFLMNFAWEVTGPRDFAMSGFSKSIAFNANLPGRYEITIAAKNLLKQCNGLKLIVGVTWKAPFLGNKLPRLPALGSYKTVAHLGAIGAFEAWAKSRGDGVRIAVLDSGVNYNHPDLSPNILNSGWDFIRGDNMPFDDTGHGTHVAGLAAGALYGVAPNAKILPVKVVNAMGSGDAGSIEQGIRYATNNGADIIVMSLGNSSDEWKTFLQGALNYAESKGVLVVVSAGNAHENNDVKPIYPASFTNSNIMVVASTTLQGALESYSNFGQRTVHVAAPGGDPDSSVGGLYGPDFLAANTGGYIRLSGTSMAAPVAAGVAALVKGLERGFTAVQIKQLLMTNSLPKVALINATASASMLSASKAVTEAERLAVGMTAHRSFGIARAM